MQTTSLKISISQSLGDISAELISVDNMKCMITLAHGAGAGMNYPFMISLSIELATLGIGTLRFNFPFIEMKKKRPDVPTIAHKAIEVAIQKATELFPALPLFAGGKSFGGRMTSQYVARQNPENVNGIIFVGFPLHPPGKATIDRADHLKEIKTPMLFLQGTRDTLAEWGLIEQVCGSLPLATLIKIEGADHGFRVPKYNVFPKLASSIDLWINESLLRTPLRS